MARKTVVTRAVSPLAPSMSAEKAVARFGRLVAQVALVKTEEVNLTVWRQDIEGVLSGYYGNPSIQLDQFKAIHFSLSFFSSATPDRAFEEARLSGIATAEAFLQSRISELQEDIADVPRQQGSFEYRASTDDRKVFLVHGHDHGLKEKVARYLEKLGLDPIILHEQPDRGRTIIEKFEDHADVRCAVVLLTGDDVAQSKEDTSKSETRARQNVIFELGYFIGKLGRKNTFALLAHGVSKPSDFDGVLYLPLEDDASWRLRLVGELKAAGMDVDANKAFA
jgi:predicted nucleotide-binding protein